MNLLSKDNTLKLNNKKSPTLSRAVDSNVRVALKSDVPVNRMRGKRESARTAAMDLGDLINRLEETKTS